ncbi:ABC transporter substrate-binding protein [Beggiatoa leptomitoformis]|uniref:Extracellular solute-binding protein n=1 Tax=Beggiatoa leptomitoformis TaxID=288004 RepID=A0A2N9YEI5_9GAMM|nr:ABC transporter substrate-binding protein [Beggiatoa leptomitoformis]ALG69516.2 extracellular solute-binding protein [Beggiatoa leptomitoformis]AUI68907.1 extracellular solute-binding protein [Beggiatoa leptomitoformis]
MQKYHFIFLIFSYLLSNVTVTLAESPAKTLTVVSWGGKYTDSQIAAYYKPFADKFGVAIQANTYNGGLGQIRSQVKTHNIKWDVVDLSLADAVKGCNDGLLEPIDLTSFPPSSNGISPLNDFYDITILTSCAAPLVVWSTVVAYNETAFAKAKKKPNKIADLFDIETFAGKRGFRKTPQVTFEWALMADGVPSTEVYNVLATAEGVERVFTMLDKIKKQIIWWDTGAQALQLLNNNEVVMTTIYNGWVADAIVNNAKPYKIIWDGQLFDLDVLSIVKGTKQLDLAIEFIKFASDTQALAEQTRYIAYSPARKSALKYLPTIAQLGYDIRPLLPMTPANFTNAIRYDFTWWAKHQEVLTDKFNAWLARN